MINLLVMSDKEVGIGGGEDKKKSILTMLVVIIGGGFVHFDGD